MSCTNFARSTSFEGCDFRVDGVEFTERRGGRQDQRNRQLPHLTEPQIREPSPHPGGQPVIGGWLTVHGVGC